VYTSSRNRRLSTEETYSFSSSMYNESMITNIDVDEKLVAEARRLTGMRTKREIVEAGLHALIQLHRQADMRQLWGRLHWQDPGAPAVLAAPAAPEEKGKGRAGRR
jgi:Arc/MetJ family transcription regulator